MIISDPAMAHATTKMIPTMANGGNGLAKAYQIEKLFRDARASITEDGENTSLALAGSEGLIW